MLLHWRRNLLMWEEVLVIRWLFCFFFCNLNSLHCVVLFLDPQKCVFSGSCGPLLSWTTACTPPPLSLLVTIWLLAEIFCVTVLVLQPLEKQLILVASRLLLIGKHSWDEMFEASGSSNPFLSEAFPLAPGWTQLLRPPASSSFLKTFLSFLAFFFYPLWTHFPLSEVIVDFSWSCFFCFVFFSLMHPFLPV